MQSNEIITANKVIYQKEIFPELRQHFGYLTNKHEKLLQILDLIDMNVVYPACMWNTRFGRPVEDRHKFVIAFLAKALWNIALTKTLIDQLKIDRVLRSICGFDERNNVLPSEATFSRVFADISKSKVGDKLLKYIITTHCGDTLHEHVAIDGSAIAVAVNDYNIPVAAIITSASVNDSLVAIPLIRTVEDRIDNLYYLMDKGYDATAIRAEVTKYEKVGLIDFNHRGNKNDTRSFLPHEQERYGHRAFCESCFSHLKMHHIPGYILYKGIEKVSTALNFALSVIATSQIIKYSSA